MGFHLFLFRARSRQVKEETFADTNPLPTQQLRQSVHFMASAIFQCSVQLQVQAGSSSCCGLSCPSAQLPLQSREPVACVWTLSRVVSQVPVCLPKLVEKSKKSKKDKNEKESKNEKNLKKYVKKNQNNEKMKKSQKENEKMIAAFRSIQHQQANCC